MAYEKIVALFDSAEHADVARRNLENAGFPAGDVSLASLKTLGATAVTLREPGFWHRLFGSDIEEHEAIVYGRTVEAGGVVLALRSEEKDIPKAMGILNAHNVVDVPQRAVQQGLVSAVDVPKPSPAPPPQVTAAAAKATSRDEVIRLAEEQLNVGKRMVQEGTTRIRRYVTEKPVEAQVTLHEEHAQVLRRAVADPDYIKDIDWSESTVEMTDTAEEAVVSKSTRIAEEVVLRKEESDRVETVKDTVRRQQVDVERLPADKKKSA